MGSVLDYRREVVYVVGTNPTRDSGLWHNTEHMVEVTQIIYN